MRRAHVFPMILLAVTSCLSAASTTAPTMAPQRQWGEAIEGLRCRWVQPAAAFTAGELAIISIEVQSVSPEPLLWECSSETTWGLREPRSPAAGSHLMPKFTLALHAGARPATGKEVRDKFGVGARGVGPDDPMPGYYYLVAGASVVLTAEYPWLLAKPGPVSIDAYVSRYDARGSSNRDAGKNNVTCPPLVLDVAPGDPQAATAYDIVWSKPADGLQAGVGYPYGRRPVPHQKWAAIDVYMRNVSDKPISLSLSQTAYRDTPSKVVDKRGKEQRVVLVPRKDSYPLLHWTIKPGEEFRVDGAGFAVRPGNYTDEAAQEEREGPVFCAEPGDYSVTKVLRYNVDGGEKLDREAVVGPIELRIVAPDAKPALTPRGGAATTQAVGGKGISVTGRVLDKPGGEGVKDIKVSLVSLADQATRSTVTDKDGRYAFGDVAYIGMAHLVQVGEHGPGVWTEDGRVFVPKPEAGAPAAIAAPDLYANTPCAISGTVKDVETGKGVADAPIRVSTADRNVAEFKTDQNGSYRLHLIPRQVQLDCDGTHDRYLPADEKVRRELTIKAGDAVKDIDFALRSATRFTGQVLLPDGAPAAKLPILAMVRWSHATVQEGRRIAAARAWREDRIRAGTEPPPAKVEVERGLVRMSDAGGVGKEFRLQTDATGHFEGYLRRPNFRVSGRDEALDIIVVVRTADKTLGAFKAVHTTTIDPPPDPIAVTLAKTTSAQFAVVDAENHPLADATCAAQSWLFGYISLGHDIPEVAPDLTNLGKGQYQATGLVAGWDYRLRASAEGYKCRNEIKVIAEPGQTVTEGKLVLER